MSAPKVAGCCSKCDAEVFDVKRRDPATQMPLQLGPAHENAVRVTFVLMNGSTMDITFCADCADGLTPSDYAPLWGRVMAAWAKQQADSAWAKSQVDNGIAGMLRKQLWREVA